MSIQATTADVRKNGRRQFLGAAGGTVLALAVAAGIGAWRLSEHSSTTTAGVPVQQARPAAFTGPADTMGGVAEQMKLRPAPAGQNVQTRPQLDTMGGLAERMATQRRLDDQAQTRVMGGEAERMQLQAELATGSP